MNISIVSSLVTSAVGFGMAMLIFFARARSKAAVLFGFYLLATSIWILVDSYAVFQSIFAISLPQIMIVAHTAAVFVPAFGFHFICVFSRAACPRWVIGLNYGVATVFLALNWFSGQFIERGPHVQMLTDGFGPYYAFFVAYLLVITAINVGILLVRSARSEGILKHQIVYFLYAISILILTIIVYGVGIYFGFSVRIENLFQLLFSVMIAYGMINIRLLDTVIILNRVMSFAVVALVAFGSIWVVAVTIPPGAIHVTLIGLIAVIWAWKGESFRRKLQLYAESNWVPGYFNSEKFFEGVLESLMATKDRAEVLAAIQSAIVAVFPYSLPRVVFPGAEEIFPKKFEEFFVSYSDPIQISGLLEKLPVPPAHVPFDLSDVLIPIHSSSELVAVICVSPSHDSLQFRDKDLALFKSLGKHAFIVLDRLIPYEKIKADYERTKEIAAITSTVIALKHEINSPLTAVLMTADYLQRSLGDTSPFKAHAESIVNDTRRIARILRQLRDVTDPIYTEYLPGVSMLDRGSEKPKMPE